MMWDFSLAALLVLRYTEKGGSQGRPLCLWSVLKESNLILRAGNAALYL